MIDRHATSMSSLARGGMRYRCSALRLLWLIALPRPRSTLDDALLAQLAIWCGRLRSAITAAASETPMTALTAQDLGLVSEIQ